MSKDLIRSVEAANDIDDLVAQFLNALNVDISHTPKGKKRLAANQRAKDILAKYNGDYSNVTEEDKQALREYTGFGGIGGSTNEYYTPKWLASAVWESLEAYGFNGGNVLEPASGVGVFSETKPANALNTSVEMDKTSAAINQILHKDDHVINSGFEAVATDSTIGNFDAVIGNPPYGVRDSSALLDKEYKDIKYADQYFVTRAIDKAKAGGLIALVLPTRIVESKSLRKWRVKLATKAEFLGAHRLPTGVFADTGVVTDLVIWRKHSEEAQEIIDTADLDLLVEAGVLWETWLSGKWFERDGKKFINGEETTKGVGQFARKVVDRGNRSNDDIKDSLTRRFKSRIDWKLLDESITEPVSEKYGDGDTVFRNGLQFEMKDGEWVESEHNARRGNVDKLVYGVESTSDIGGVTYGSESMLNLTASQAMKLYEDYPYLCDNHFKKLMHAISELPQGQQETAYRGILLGRKVKNLSNMIASGRTKDDFEYIDDSQVEAYRDRLGGQITEFNARSGSGRLSKKELAKLDESVVSDWHSYSSAINKKGELSDLLKGELKVEQTIQYNTDRIGDVLHFAERQLGKSSLTIDEVRLYYSAAGIETLSDEQLLDRLAGIDEVAVNSDGSISAMHRACTGHVGKRVEHLQAQMSISTSDAIKANCMRQLDTINAKRKKIELSNVKMKLTDNWIPREIMLEFLHDAGYTEFVRGTYTSYQEQVVKDGELQFNKNGTPKMATITEFEEDPNGADFAGYRWRDGKKRNVTEESFERQIESYINDGKVRGGSDNAEKSLMRSRMRALDDEFTNWLAGSAHSDELEAQYNNTFNNWIKPDFDGSDLGLEGVSGAVNFFSYQNATIRRHSADGNGIIAFGTGLGKTLTGLGLIQYNLQTKRCSRVAVVVPKSTLENWFYESDLFYGESNLGDKVFIGLEVEKDESGSILREPVFDENGNPRLDKNDKPIQRARLKVVTNGSKIAEQLHAVTQSKARVVVMTKDVYGRIPMKPESIKDNLKEMQDAGLIANSDKIIVKAESHRDQEKKARFDAKYSDDGTGKNDTLPYFEDLLFDSVMVDEAHDFRNSYKGGSYRNNLAFLPNQAQADRAIDMQLKNNLIKARNDGNGVFFLTATPTVNSPVDMFNMLSHIVPKDTFAKMGIFDSDDFIRMFGKTGEALVTKISGEVESREALLGFQNLQALRNIVNRYMTMEDIKSVGSDVTIPELDASTFDVQMNEEQEALYEELRQRADAISNPDKLENQEIVEKYPNDTIFGLIRKMDKVASDLDLYHERVTFRFSKAKTEEVQALLDKMPDTIKVEVEVADENTGELKKRKVDVALNKEITFDGKHGVVQLHQSVADKFTEALNKAKVKYTHPVSPKFAKFLERAKAEYLAGGKQLVFTEEKTQHKKVAKMIADYTGCKLSEIGILNSDTVSGKKGSKATDEDDENGLEAMASAYNTSKYCFMILNKKGEVGINLHHGTTIIHHLSLPWTPMSITQRNGRGARVGSKQDSVRVFYYVSKGSFDQFRLTTIQRKANWVETMFKGDDDFIANADADAADETAVMLAADPEEAKRRIAENKLAAKKRQEAERLRQAAITMNKYIHASNQLSMNVADAHKELDELNAGMENLTQELEETRLRANGESRNSWAYGRYEDAKKAHFDATKRIKSLEAAIANRDKATSTLKKLKPAIEKEISGGALKDFSDFLQHPELYLVRNGRIVRVGYTYKTKLKLRRWDANYTLEGLVTIDAINRKAGTVDGMIIEQDGSPAAERLRDHPIDKLLGLAEIDQSRAELEAKAASGVSLADTCNVFDRETYFELIETGKLRRYGFERCCLVKTEKGYSTPHGFQHSPEAPIVYPDATNKEVSQALLKQVIADIENKGTTRLDHDILAHFIGKNWYELAKEQGNRATEQEVIERVTLEIKNFETEKSELFNQALMMARDTYYSKVEYFNQLDEMVDYLLSRGYVNNEDINQWKRRIVVNYRDQVTKRSEEHLAEQEDLVFSEFVKLVENDSTRAERLSEVAYWMDRYKQQHAFSKKLDEIYRTGDVQKDLLTVAADAQAVGLKTYESGDGLVAINNRFLTNAIYVFESVFAGYGSVMRASEFIDKHLEANPPKPKPVPLTIKQSEKLDNIDGYDSVSIESFASAVSQLGIEVKPLTQNIGKWNFQRNGRGKRYGGGGFDAYSRIALNSNERGGGALKEVLAGNKELKAAIGAQWIPAGAFEEYGFIGGWWFIKSDCDLPRLESLLFAASDSRKVA
ncbi:TPA: Eco57I restriction-modification methylase domain-containing protein [Vibrio parahaemolyticus]|nr:Eco57I restriction-modification methylase domain-containing protein [Vibrio parahaemolyticus]HCG9589036.1 Eco57I restriction-modification methylase domain-containing protein [Vibrio parahaemolyticus]HCM0851050.1 Eco57I restriction-modification methylase domain-containing protein [Vibrio parahaemolyticus]